MEKPCSFTPLEAVSFVFGASGVDCCFTLDSLRSSQAFLEQRGLTWTRCSLCSLLQSTSQSRIASQHFTKLVYRRSGTADPAGSGPRLTSGLSPACFPASAALCTSLCFLDSLLRTDGAYCCSKRDVTWSVGQRFDVLLLSQSEGGCHACGSMSLSFTLSHGTVVCALQLICDWLGDIQCLALSRQSLAASASSMALRCRSPVHGLRSVPHGQAGAASLAFLQAVPLSELTLRLPSGHQGTVACWFFTLPGHGSLLWRDKPAAVGQCYLSLVSSNATAPKCWRGSRIGAVKPWCILCWTPAFCVSSAVA